MKDQSLSSFWERAHEHLDARRDPLDDPDVQCFLEQNPHHLEEFAALQQGLRALGPAFGPRRRKVPWAAAAIVFCALGVLWLLSPGNGELPAPDIAHGGRILEVDITIVMENHETRTEITRTGSPTE
jgi:hypothetical protein